MGFVKLRRTGNSVVLTAPSDAMRKLGLIEDDGDLHRDDIHTRATVYDDGTIEYDIDTDDIPKSKKLLSR